MRGKGQADLHASVRFLPHRVQGRGTRGRTEPERSGGEEDRVGGRVRLPARVQVLGRGVHKQQVKNKSLRH